MTQFSNSLNILGAFLLLANFSFSQTRTSIQNGLFNNPNTWDCSCIPSSGNDVVIASGDTVLLSANTTVNAVFIQKNAQLDNNGRRFDVNGNYTVDGEHTGAGVIRLFGLNAVLDGNGVISNARNFDIRNTGMSIRDTASLSKIGGGSFRLIGAVTLTNYGYFETSRNITRNNNGSLWYNATGATVVAGRNFMNNNQVNATDSGNTIIYNRLGNQTVVSPISGEYYNLIIDGSGNKTLSNNLIINNNLELRGGTFRVNALTVNLKGDFFGSGGLLNEGSGEFQFTGTSDQLISAAAEERFYNVSVNKTQGVLRLNQKIEVSNTFSLQNGLVDARSKALTLGTGTGNIGLLSYVNGHIQGTFSRWINTSTNSYLYPLGDGTNYLPAELNFTTVVNGRLNGRFSSAYPSNNGLPLDDGDSLFNTFSEGYWRFSDTSGLAGSVFNLQLTANGFSSYTLKPSTRLIFRNNPGSNWQLLGSHTSAISPLVFRNTVNTFPIEAALADTTKCLLPSPNTSAISGMSVVCKSAVGSNYSVLNTPGSLYLWTIVGGSQISGDSTNTISVNWGDEGIEGSVQVIEYNGCEYGNPVLLNVSIQPVDPIEIFGQDPGYEGTSGNVYNVEENAGYTYNWTVSGAASRSGSGSNDTILVDFISSGVARLEVFLSNGCGNSDTLIRDITVAAAIKSISTGNWSTPSTWDCNCNPGNNSSVQIQSPHTVTMTANERAFAVIIEPGAALNMGTRQLRVTNLLSNKGSVSGSGQLRIDQTGSLLTGEGIWTGHSGSFNFRPGLHTISSEANIQKTGTIAMTNNTSVINYGTLVTNGAITGTNSSTWEQKENSVLQIGNFSWTNGTFIAFAPGNSVIYSSTGNFTRNVRVPANGQYYDLGISGSAVGSVYRLNNGDIQVLGDLNLTGGTLDVGAANFTIELEGNWNNSGLNFNQRAGLVKFVGVNQSINESPSSRQNFFNVSVSSTGTLSANCELEIQGSLAIEFGSVLDMNASNNYELNVLGNVSNRGQINLYDNTLLLNGSSLQSLKGDFTAYDLTIDNVGGVDVDSGITELRHVLDIQNGQLNTKNSLDFISNATETAMIGDLTGGGSIVGDVKVQRYLDEGNGWYLLASPVVGSDIEDWNTEVYMSGFPGSDGSAGGFISVQSYVENARAPSGNKDEGFTPPTNSSNVIGAGDGYFVYYQTVKQGVLANTLDINGPLLTGTYSTGSLSHTLTGTADDRGWHLVGNPYASPVDFSLLTISNLVNSTAYVKRAGGNYWDIVNDNIDYLYSAESMWVKANTGGGSVTFNESDKAIVDDDYNARKAAKTLFKDPLKIHLSSPAFPGYSDFMVLRFGGDSNSVNYDPVFGESVKLGNSYGYYPNIASYSENDSINVYYNSLNPADSSQTIPLNVFTVAPANNNRSYTIEFEGIEGWSKNNHCLILIDSLNNKQLVIDSGNNQYSFTMMDTFKLPKLFLEHTAPLTSNIQAVSCFGEEDGLLKVKGSGGSGRHDYSWYDAFGKLVQADLNHAGYSVLSNLPSGKYTVEVSGNGQCGTIWQQFELNEVDPVVSQFDAPDTVALIGDSVKFINSSVNASHFEWDFNDGFTSTKENPEHKFLKEGAYKVSLKALRNNDCYEVSYKVIDVQDFTTVSSNAMASHITCYAFEHKIYLLADLEGGEELKITVFNELGQALVTDKFSGSVVDEIIDMKTEKGIVFVRIETVSSTSLAQFSKKLLLR